MSLLDVREWRYIRSSVLCQFNFALGRWIQMMRHAYALVACESFFRIKLLPKGILCARFKTRITILFDTTTTQDVNYFNCSAASIFHGIFVLRTVPSMKININILSPSRQLKRFFFNQKSIESRVHTEPSIHIRSDCSGNGGTALAINREYNFY